MTFHNRKFLYGNDTMEDMASNDNYEDIEDFENDRYLCGGHCCYCDMDCPYQERY